MLNSILIGAALKSTIVLGAAWLLTLILRRNSAAARHLVWTAAAAAVLAVPLLSLELPSLRVPAAAPAALPSQASLIFRMLAIATAPPAAMPQIPRAAAYHAAAQPPDLKTWLLWLWLAGAALMLLRLLVAYAVTWRVRRAARPFPDPQLAPAGVDLLEAPAGRMPAAFGILHPAIFLPADAAGWSDERRRIVVEHELAHIRRGDIATHLLARSALSLYWWNPLAWIAWREFLKERERAADDWVLAAGARASDYAAHLLEIARSMQSAPAAACASVAMARRSELEGRLLAILDSGLKRRNLGRAAVLIASLAAVLAVAPFAALRAQQEPNAEPNVRIRLNAAAAAENTQADAKLDAEASAILQRYGPQSAEYATALVRRGDLALRQSRAGDAYHYFAQVAALPDMPQIVPALVQLGIHAIVKDPTAAQGFFERALAINSSGNSAGTADTWLAFLADRQGDTAGADALFQKGLALENPESADAATTLDLYALFLRRQNRDSEADAAQGRAKAIRQARMAELQAKSRRGAQATEAFRVDPKSGVLAPKLLYKVEPDYTEEARVAKYQGTVLLYVEVGPDGYAHNIQVKKSLGLGLDEKAAEAVMQWKFAPGTKDGQAVTVAATIEVNFRLL